MVKNEKLKVKRKSIMRLLLFLLMTVTSMVTWGEDSIYHYGESKRACSR